MHALFVFAHQDDEIAFASRISYALRNGRAVSCAYLTDGEGKGIPSATRDRESRRVLAHLGVDLARVHFIGSEERIPDGKLVEQLDRALALLDARVTEAVDEIYCLAWEGGHADHDASQLVAAAFAARRGVLAKCYEMPLYHGHRLPGPLFNTLAPLRVGGPWTGRQITLREAFGIALLCRFYDSQRATWMGLLPEALIRLALGQREHTRPVDVARLTQKPHEGKLFYERRFGVSWESFARASAPFVAQLTERAHDPRENAAPVALTLLPE
ncbi:MAG: PIG-L family deacetylase [Acidobacteria bacterium]|nr:PIG-L family deacetylase [Acidobacteriota bacterium]MBV9478765.1 PIG-L family deacetylase [Acidobacteriota bacterium]